jgi:hypothetical protein
MTAPPRRICADTPRITILEKGTAWRRDRAITQMIAVRIAKTIKDRIFRAIKPNTAVSKGLIYNS